MAQISLLRTDLGAGSSLKVTGKDFTGQLLQDVNGREVRYENCDFSASVVERGYFFKAAFIGCKFVGTRFSSAVFRSATFERCDFRYADFNRCVVPVPQLLANLPDEHNIRWDLLNNLRANARNIGDQHHEAELIRHEIAAEIEHWRAVGHQKSNFYQKYSSKERFWARLRVRRLIFERVVWGHGESLLRLVIATLLALAALGTVGALTQIGSMQTAITPDALFQQWLNSLWFSGALFIDLPSVSSSSVTAHPVVSVLIVLLRYLSIGLAIPVLYKYIAKR
jgi:hypothetical protein